MNLRNAVKFAAAEMDKDYPGWAAKIDTTRLDMGNSDLCVLGQATGDYWAHQQRDFINRVERGLGGHEVFAGNSARDYWRDEISLRLEPVPSQLEIDMRIVKLLREAGHKDLAKKLNKRVLASV